MEHGLSYWLPIRRLRRQCGDVRPVRTVGVPHCCHSPADGRTFRVSAHAPTALVSHNIYLT